MATQGLSLDAAQDEINGRLYQRSDLVGEYAVINLYPPETTVLVRYREDIERRRVLDLGCGSGRLAIYLRPLTDHYVGMDLSPHMTAYCRKNIKGLQFFQGDMRTLGQFGPGSFDTVFAVFNLLDAVSHEDRLRVLAEIRRVLSGGGLLVFSSHNRNYSQAGAAPRLSFSRNPFTQLRCLVDFLKARENHRRIKVHQRIEPEYSLLNDSGHNFSVLHYYIRREDQARQLAEAGFQLLECLDEFGRTLRPSDDDRAFSSIHYVARSTV